MASVNAEYGEAAVFGRGGRAKSGAQGPFAQSGFTLIELLVVIAIIAMLASLLIPALSREKARAQGKMTSPHRKQSL